MTDTKGDGSIDADKLRNFIRDTNDEQSSIASTTGDLRAEIKQFCEDTQINKKALSWLRNLDRMASEKRADVIRSLENELHIMDPVWSQQAELDLDDAA